MRWLDSTGKQINFRYSFGYKHNYEIFASINQITNKLLGYTRVKLLNDEPMGNVKRDIHSFFLLMA